MKKAQRKEILKAAKAVLDAFTNTAQEHLDARQCAVLERLENAVSPRKPEPVAWVLEFDDPDPQNDIEFQKDKPKGWPENKCYPLYKEQP